MHAPTLGTLMHMDDLAREAQGKTRLEYIRAKLKELNFRYCWTPGLKDKWPIVNRLLWRFDLMFGGGITDCFLAGFEGALPHQQLYPYGTTDGEGYLVLPGYRPPSPPRKQRRGAYKAHRTRYKPRHLSLPQAGAPRAIPQVS